ncbi:hypothetical protein ACO0QE_000031 [Hanseniaspora vineae]
MSTTTEEIKQYTLNNGTVITQTQLDHWNKQLSSLQPQEVLQWAICTFPNLSQITAFGLSGLVIIDLLHKAQRSVAENEDKSKPENKQRSIPLIFVDTLHHFPQTLELLQKIETKYYSPYDEKIFQDALVKFNLLKNMVISLWEKDDDQYDYLVKVEPLNRAYKDLQIDCVFTGRRKSQGGMRESMPIVEVDEVNKVVKINPLRDWDFKDVKKYIDDNKVPFNELLDLGYKSIGDYHSTVPTGADGDERGGRWNGTVKTECGIHDPKRFLKYMK